MANTKRIMTDDAFKAYDLAKLLQDMRLLYNLFDTCKTAFYQFVNDAKTAITTTKNAAISHIDLYAPQECLTESEYAAKQTAGTIETDKQYFIYPNS